MVNYFGVLKVKEVGTNSASRKARIKGYIKQAEEIEKRCMEKHIKILDEGWIYNKGCTRYTSSICTCSKCKKINN